MIKPLGTRVLVKHLPPEEKTKEGIIVGAALNPNYFVGEVIALGTDMVWKEKNGLTPIKNVNVGDHVAYLKYGYEDMGNNQHLVEENSLLALYEGETETQGA